MEPRIIAAQTLRTKVIYDVSQLPTDALLPLRDSLLSCLETYTSPQAPTGSKAIVVQLCLALADLAYQVTEAQWPGVVPEMIEKFGSRPDKVTMLLELLKSLVEEAGNARIPISASQARNRAADLLSSQTDRVLELLGMYLIAPGVTPQIQAAVFSTLTSWLRAGELDAGSIARTPLFDFAFDALSSDALFDEAADVICDLIHETQEVEDNVEVIQQIVPKVLALQAMFAEAKADEVDDRVRGFCRIFAEAGETYRQLILDHPDTFLPLVQALGQCAAYPDLDIVPITFNFWYKLAQAIGQSAKSGPFIEIFAHLQDAMITHLRFPSDNELQTAADRDEFRSFRHIMGDTLKDCCQVLGAAVCMKRSYELVTQALQKQPVVWQEVEAPLFSMRSMGAEVDPQDDEVLPHIMDLIPQLPNQPKIQYAATLVISRYTQWIDQHPNYLPFQLNYVSAGFQSQDTDVTAAAAQAMKYLCQDCKEHLVPYLDQLYSFITTAATGLPIEDRLEVAEAIGYVVGSMPPEQAAQALQRFCQPSIEVIQRTAAGPMVGRDELVPALEALEQIDAYLANLEPMPLPPQCTNTAAAIYDVFDGLLSKYNTYSIADRTSRAIRRGLAFFPLEHLQALLPRLVARMCSGFETGGYAAYIWIIGKVAGLFGDRLSSMGPHGSELEGAISTAFDRVTAHTSRLEREQGAYEMPDTFDDYVQFINSLLAKMPSVLLNSSSLPDALRLVITSTSLPSPGSVMSGLELIDDLLRLAISQPQATSILMPLLTGQGQTLSALCLHGLVRDFPEDAVAPVGDLMKDLCTISPPDQMRVWVRESMASLPTTLLPASSKEEFLAEFDK